MTDVSILNLAPLREGESFLQAIDDMVALAQFAETHGYTRYWIAEHHNMPYVASSATSLLIQKVLDNTRTIRVGAGGVMLPNHSPFVVAEQYGTLATLHPNRVDLGLGRAPGTDPATARAIRRHQDDFAMSFPNDIKDLQFYFGDGDDDKVRAYPAKGLNVPLYILGSSTESAYLAAELGLPYAFASHFAPRFLTQAVKIYRQNFRPSAVLDKPKVIVGINAIIADTDDEAKLLASTSVQFFTNVVTGERSGMKPPVADIESRMPPYVIDMAKSMMAVSLIGSPNTAKAQLADLQAKVQADELMAVSYIYDKAAQRHSYQLLADVVNGD
ncbi:luciferase family oxidoreductase [Moraxella caviae]|uniref:Luciferase-like monooxygenase n=1 Tax=Moraxella caviae TaxID=34060 RepID=A0A1T0ABU0_9GAMM|nr:LLM class flavin-dependent oxidoreductase [Moraxella caviae]OOR93173.1 luciferase family oxidoreductase [Moraxella caviae]STZ10441.1 Limonene 1,2-monooxygenase [Moraxella caviae]